MTKKLTNIFFCTSFFALLTMPLASPLPAAEEPPVEDIDPVSLYFDMEETTTRSAKPLSQVAENVSIVTAEEIERMNAHNVAEVLNRVPGFVVQFNGRDFNGSEEFHPQDADFQHVLVLVDGIRWNDVYSGIGWTNALPIEIISRIEVIKGPASSTWGSALGGVVNIITKNTGVTQNPTGTLSASYGEANSQEYTATVAGKNGKIGYFISGGSQSSDGLMGNRFYDRENVFGKVSIDLPYASTLTLTSFYSEPEMRFFDWYAYNWRAEASERDFLNALSLDSILTGNISLHASVFRSTQKHIRTNYTLPDKIFSSEWYQDNWTNGVNAILNGNFGSHQLVAGVEFERSKSEDDINVTSYDEVWAVYLNDTYTFGNFTITPGIRFDHLSLSDDFTSPSLGLTWQFADNSLLRALVARGFKRPYIEDINYANPDINLKPERITSYQFGLETGDLLSLATLKATVFEHHLKDTWEWDANYYTYNAGDTKRYGYELELNTVSVHHLSAQASLSYTYTDYYGSMDNDDQYSGKLTMLYDNPSRITLELFGSYAWLNEDRSAPDAANNMIWELNASKEVQTGRGTSIRFFAAVHNIFDSRDYWHPIYENPHRWVEAGLRFNF